MTSVSSTRTPGVSVLLPARNAERYLHEALCSIRRQSYPDFELLILDDGSTDATAAIARRHATEDPRLSLIPLPPGTGIAAALNIGLARARGEWIARMDADDIACSERFERQLAFLRDHPEVAVLGTGVWLMGPTGRDVGRSALGPTTQEDFAAQRDAIRINFTHPTVMYRRRIVMDAGGYAQSYPAAEDFELWNRLASDHVQLTLPEPLLHYRVHDAAAGTRSLRVQAESWARAREDIRRARSGLPPIPPEEFRTMRRRASLWKRADRELKLRSRSAYRRGAARLASGNMIGVPWVLISLALYPRVPLSRFKRQVLDGRLGR